MMYTPILLWFSVLDILVLVIAYDVSNTQATWTEAANQCEMLAEPVQYTATGNALNLEYNPVLSEEGAWVGYYMTWTAFEYIGCVSRFALSQNKTHETVGDPGQCYSACNYSKYFGLLVNECFCLDYKTVESMADKRRFCLQCITKFPGSQGPACGFGRDNTIALYKVNDAVLMDSSIYERGSTTREELCLEYSPKTRTFIWGTCSRALRVMCQTDKGVEIFPEDIGLFTWISAMVKCMRNGSDPTSFESSSSVSPASNASFWTGVVRARVIHSHVVEPIDTRAGKKWYGYITKQERYWLNFTEELVQKQFICHKGNNSTTDVTSTTRSGTSYSKSSISDVPSTTSSGNSYSRGSTSDVTSTIGSGTSYRKSSTSDVPTTTGSGNSDKVPDSEGLTVPVYVVVVVVVALLALIAAIVFLLIWKSRNAKNKHKHNEVTQEQDDYIQPGSQHHTESIPQYEQLKQGSSQPAYSDLTLEPTNTDMEHTRTNSPLQYQDRGVQNRDKHESTTKSEKTLDHVRVSSKIDYLNPVCDGGEGSVYATIPDTTVYDNDQYAVGSDYEEPHISETQIKRLY